MKRRVFDLAGPLPTGAMSIGASAGTGKTHALSTLAARYVTEADVAVQKVLVVTFTRAAAAELKDRVRSRLVEFAAALEQAVGDPGSAPEDPVLAQLCATDPAVRLQRARTAVTEFDSATITTIHGFAHQVLGTLGSVVRTDPDAVLVDDTVELARQAATDLLVARAVAGEDGLPRRDELDRLSVLALANPDARLHPRPETLHSADTSGALGAPGAAGAPGDPPEPDPDASALALVSMVQKVSAMIRQRRMAAGTMSFDDLLWRLREALVDPATAPAARTVLRQRYSVALIDEFQDTDPVQWEIFDSAFGDATGGGSALVVVGDPKQAIYGFRGANVHTYLSAVEAMDSVELSTNWRSGPDVLAANEALLTGTTFGVGAIGFEAVGVAPRNAGHRMVGSSGDALPALQVNLAAGDAVKRHSTSKHPHPVTIEAGVEAAIRDVARHVRELLEGARIPDEDGPEGSTRPVRPEDVAVLVTRNADTTTARDALDDLGIPAVIAKGESVLRSTAALHWQRLLGAVARPGHAPSARAGASSWFGGWNARDVAAASDEELLGQQERFAQWARVLDERGVAAFVGSVMAASGVAARVLGYRGGQRHLTDLDHIGELLTGACGHANSPSALLAAFEQLGFRTDDTEATADLAARRVESDSSAVKVMTTFTAKGLEFPVVCCPNLWLPMTAKVGDKVWWADGERHIDLAPKLEWGPDDERRHRDELAFAEVVGSSLRVLYVALTRAHYHTAVWWAPAPDAWRTALARVLFGRDDSGAVDPEALDATRTERVEPLDVEGSLARLAPLLGAAGGTIAAGVVGNHDDDTRRPWQRSESGEPRELAAATLGRTLPRHTNRWSFSRLTDTTAHRVDPDDDSSGDAASADESTAAGPTDQPATTAGQSELPLGHIAGGAGFGNLVHGVLERLDFASGDLERDLGALVEERLAWDPWSVDPGVLVAGLAAVVRTPLGTLFDGAALADLGRGDRLDELEFDFTLGEGGPAATAAEVGRVVLDHLDPDSPFRPWAESFTTRQRHGGRVLAGHMTGSIDLVARVASADGPSRYVVCDYKTNRLAGSDEEPTAATFSPVRLPAAMAEHDYPLQALIYSVALHRYLRWRLAGYDPEVHLGGVGYLFVRGMVGPDTPTVDGVPHGLARWNPPASLVTTLSDLFDGTAPSTSKGRP